MDPSRLVAALTIAAWVVSCSGSTTGGTGGSSTTQGGGGTGGEATGGEAGNGGGRVRICCGVDLPCPAGFSCAGRIDLFTDNVGECQPTPVEGSCWNDMDCPRDGMCVGQPICRCDVVCTAPPRPGDCEPIGEPCCRDQSECTSGQICVAVGTFVKGRCVPPLAEGECYRDEDCPGGTCNNAQDCPCLANCPTLPGTCSTP